MKRIILLSMTLVLTVFTAAQSQDTIRKLKKGGVFEKPGALTIKPIGENEDLVKLSKLLVEAKAARNLSDAEVKLEAAERLCAEGQNCASKITVVRREIYLPAFQQKMRQLRSADWRYPKQLSELDILEEYLSKGKLEAVYQQRWQQLTQKVHEEEVRRLLAQQAEFESYLESLDQAFSINTTHLDGKLTALIRKAERDAVDQTIDDLLNRRGRRGDFRQQLRRIEKAYSFIERLPERDRRNREERLARYRQEVVQDEFLARRSALNHSTDWRETLVGYERLFEFARRYNQDLERFTIRRLRQDREVFLVQEYEVRIQESSRRLQSGDLTGAQAALAGAVELSHTNLLPEGPAAYRHRELYQTLYEAQHDRLQNYKLAANWDGAEQTIQIIGSLFQDAPFILARASIKEERQLLEVARWEFFLAEADQVINYASEEEQYAYFHQLLDGYRELRGLLNRNHEIEVAQAVQKFGREPMEASRKAAERNDFSAAMQTLQSWNEFLYTSGYRTVLSDRLYSDFESLFSYVIKGEQNQLIQGMQEGNYNYQSALAVRHAFKLRNVRTIPRDFIKDLEDELHFMEAYERGKNALGRANYQASMQYFEKATDRQSKFRADGFYTIPVSEKSSLIDNGKRLSLEGMLMEEIDRSHSLAASAKKEAYRSVWRLRRSHRTIPISQRTENALIDAELNWFGGACRTDYRKYTLHMLDAEEAIDQGDYSAAVAALQQAKLLLNYIDRCMLPVDDVDDQIKYYQLAVDFKERKAMVTSLHHSNRFEALDEAYRALWNDYQAYDIRQKFGYQLISFEEYVTRSADAQLLEYFILNNCTEDAYLNTVVESIRQISHQYSKDKMQKIGAEVAYRMYAWMPARKYQSSFGYLTPNGAYHKKAFKGFKKGYKKQWKKMR